MNLSSRYPAMTIAIGKFIQRATALRGGGSALPGLVIEKLDPNFLARSLADLPHGVVVVTGTNGKTTTTKMVAELLTDAGLRVFTNRSGSNFTRGIASAVLHEIGRDGSLPHEIAVLELDEAHAVHFVRLVKPGYVLALNVMRDQLDRFGEIDHTARLIATVVSSATKAVVLNADDPRIANLADTASVDVSYFGADPALHTMFVSDDQLHGAATQTPGRRKTDVRLTAIDQQTITLTIDRLPYRATMKLTGAYNFLNAAGALAIVRRILPDRPIKDTVAGLERVEPAFGRGERIMVNGYPLELILVKNPAGFRLALASFEPRDTPHMIVINDQYADGRDMSWLWDVDFSCLRAGGVTAISGVRAYDMALRLQYDNVEVATVETDLEQALQAFLAVPVGNQGDRRVYCTYTAMLAIRRLLAKTADVKGIL